MRKTLREQLIKQSLNGYMWSRYLVASVSQECPLIVGHHNGLDMDDLTTDFFDLNLSLLKALRDALKGKGASPQAFDQFFGLEGEFPRSFHQRTKLFVTFRDASDSDLATIAPIFGGSLFRPIEQDRIQTFLEVRTETTSPDRQIFKGFIETFWLSAWLHAKKTPQLTSMTLGIEPALVERLQLASAHQMLQLVRSDLPFRFSIKMSEPLIMSSKTNTRNSTLRLLQIANLLQNRTREELLGFKD